MRLQGDKIALFLSGQDVPVPECNIIIHQPTIAQIVMFKESSFLTAINLLGNVHENAERLRKANPRANEFSDFQILMALINQDTSFQSSIDSFFRLIFPRYKIDVQERDINFFENDRKVGMINQFNYEAFEKTVQGLFSLPNSKDEMNPANDKAAKIAEKLKKRKEILNKKKGLEDESPSLYGSYISVMSVGMGIDINVLFQYTPFQLYDLFNRYWKKNSSDFYLRVSTMPMMDTSEMEEPEPWTDNLYGK